MKPVGSLKVDVISAKNVPKTDLSGTSSYIRVSVGSIANTTLVAKARNGAPQYNEKLEFQLMKDDLEETIVIQLFSQEGDALIGSAEIAVSNVTQKKNTKKQEYPLSIPRHHLEGNESATVSLGFEWVEASKPKSKATEEKPKATEEKSKKNTTAESIPKSVVVAPEQLNRSQYLRALFYYDLTKKTIIYTKGFRVVAPIARMVENSTNYFLGKLGYESIGSIEKVDGSIVPMLDSADQVVDANLAKLLGALSNGQQYVLETKDAAVERAYNAASSTKDTVTSVAQATKDKVVYVASSTKDRVSNIAGATKDAVSNVAVATKDKVTNVASSTASTIVVAKDSTVDTVSNATIKTYKTVSAAAWYALQHVPIVGKKIMA